MDVLWLTMGLAILDRVWGMQIFLIILWLLLRMHPYGYSVEIKCWDTVNGFIIIN